MRIALITPLVDPHDPLLGFIHTWVERLASRVEHLHVLQLWRSSPELPSNVTLHSLDRNGPGGRAAVLARLASVLGPLCWTRSVDGVIAHMGPIFAICAAPLARSAGLPVALWYAHGSVSPLLRLAHALVDRVGTSTPDGFRIRSSKVRITGQGIDTDVFAPQGESDPNLIVSIGRISPVKHYESLIKAVAMMRSDGSPARLRIVGGTTLPSERAYRGMLERQIAAFALSEAVELIPGVPHDRIAGEYQCATLFASCSQTGRLDKAVLEAASCGTLPVTSNPALKSFFGPEVQDHLLPGNDPAAIAATLREWLARDRPGRLARASLLRDRVVRQHSVDHLADELVGLVSLGAPAPRAAAA
jgi:glycosyltransferase involved in cell wall biosynthesis